MYVVRVYLYVNLTRCPFTHVLVGPLGWAGRDRLIVLYVDAVGMAVGMYVPYVCMYERD